MRWLTTGLSWGCTGVSLGVSVARWAPGAVLGATGVTGEVLQATGVTDVTGGVVGIYHGLGSLVTAGHSWLSSDAPKYTGDPNEWDEDQRRIYPGAWADLDCETKVSYHRSP